MGDYELVNGKIVIGLVENIEVQHDSGTTRVTAKIDTGATKSSIDARLADSLKLGPVKGSKVVKSAHGNMLRPIVEATITLAGKTVKVEFTIADRNHLKYKLLIGQNVLKNGFLIDPSKD